jgi:hypothetical protein
MQAARSPQKCTPSGVTITRTSRKNCYHIFRIVTTSNKYLSPSLHTVTPTKIELVQHAVISQELWIGNRYLYLVETYSVSLH